MVEQIMRGATTAREHIAAFLEARVPELIVAARAQWGLDDWQLPMPKRYNAYDPLTVSEYPMIGSLVTRTSDWVRTDIDDYAEEMYEARYAVRVFIWCRTPQDPRGTWETPTYDTALRCRDDLLAIMRTAILGTPSLRTGGICKVDERSLIEDYLDAIKQGDQMNHWMVGGTLAFDMQMNEANYVPRLGVANDVTIEGRFLVP